MNTQQPKHETIEESSVTLQEQFLPYCDHQFANREDNAVNCIEVAYNFAIGFAEWLRQKTSQVKGDRYKLYSDFEIYNLQELLQIYKSQL